MFQFINFGVLCFLEQTKHWANPLKLALAPTLFAQYVLFIAHLELYYKLCASTQPTLSALTWSAAHLISHSHSEIPASFLISVSLMAPLSAVVSLPTPTSISPSPYSYLSTLY